MQDSAEDGKIKATYDRLSLDRQWYLTEGMYSARLTIPSIMPRDQDASMLVGQSPEDLPKPWQSTGARGVRNLSSKLGLTLFPPTGAFMRYQLHPQFKAELEAEGNEAQRTEIEAKLAAREQTLMDDIESSNVRTKADQALRHLLVVGNALVYLPPTGGMRVFPLNNYVVRRDFVGKPIELIYLELLDRGNLPENIRETLVAAGEDSDPETGELTAADHKAPKAVKVYTRLILRKKRYHVSQEADGHAVDLEGKTSIAEEKMPFLPLRMVAIDGEDYGRGYVEEFRGDLRSLEELRKSIVIASLNASKLTPMIQPGAVVTPKKLMEAANGQAIFGRPDDVTMLQQNKQGDMRVAQVTASEIKQDLAAAFLLNSSMQRDAERVTAEEIRRMAEELEDALGGIFSVLSQGLQLPIALRTEDRLIKNGDLTELEPKGAVKPTVVTGLAAIGRGHEFNRLREFVAFIRDEVAPMNPEAGSKLSLDELFERAGIGLGVSTNDLVRSDEELQADAQAAQQANMRQTLLEGAAPALGQSAVGELGGQLTAGNVALPPQ